MAYYQIIRDTAANWTALNPVLLPNQIGVESNIVDNVETETLLSKLGNGIDAWSSLPYWPPGIDGDVQGPASATDNAVAAFDGTTGKLIKDGASVNVLGKQFVESFTTTATAAGTTTLTVSSNPIQAFTGVTTQTVVLPVVTTLPKTGFAFVVINDSTGALTVNSSGANLVQTMAAGSRAVFTCILLTGTTAASWAVTYTPVAVSIPFTAASSSSSASLAFAEDTDNGAHKVTLKAPASVTANVDVTLPDAACTLGYLNIPQQPFSAAYPIVAADAGKHLYHPVGDANARQVTIPANASVPFELGTAITIINDSPNNVTVVITTDTLAYADVGTITTLTIPQYNQATILKVTTTQWNASGTAGCTTA